MVRFLETVAFELEVGSAKCRWEHTIVKAEKKAVFVCCALCMQLWCERRPEHISGKRCLSGFIWQVFSAFFE